MNELKTLYPQIPLLGLTATASQEATKKIISEMKMDNVKIVYDGGIRSSLSRSAGSDLSCCNLLALIPSNLFYEIREVRSSDYKKSRKAVAWEEAISWIKQQDEGACGIVYCATKILTEETALELEKNGLRVAVYHAG